MSGLRFFNPPLKRFLGFAIIELLVIVSVCGLLGSYLRGVAYLDSTNQIEVRRGWQTVRFAMPFPLSKDAILDTSDTDWSPDGKYVEVGYGYTGSSGSTIVLDLEHQRMAVVGGPFLFSGCSSWSQDSRQLYCRSGDQYGNAEETVFDVDLWEIVSTTHVKGCYGARDPCTPTRY